MADLNECTGRTLVNFADISCKAAQNIVSYRKENGAIHTYDELINVDGVNRTVLRKLKDKTELKDSPLKAKNDDTDHAKNENINNSGKRKVKTEPRKIKAQKKNITQQDKAVSGKSAVMVPLLRMDQSGSSPNSVLHSPVQLLTPVKVTPSKSGHKIIAEYSVLSEDKIVRHNGSRTMSSRASLQVNPPTVFMKKTNKPSTSKYGRLSQSKERSIRSWLTGIDKSSQKSPSTKGQVRTGKFANRQSSESRKQQSMESPKRQSMGNKKLKKSRNTHQKHASPKRRDGQNLGPTSQSVPCPIINKIKKTDKNIRTKQTIEDVIRENPKHYNTVSKFRNEMFDEPHSDVSVSPEPVNGKRSFSHRVSHGTKQINPQERLGTRAMSESFQELQAQHDDPENKRTFIRRSSFIRERSITPATSQRDFYSSDTTTPSSDRSLIKHKKHGDGRDRRRRRKRHESYHGRHHKRQHRNQKKSEDDDQAPPCSVL